MLKGILNIVINAVVLLTIGAFAVQRLGVAPWLIFAFLLVVAITCYIGNSILINYFIAKRAPEMADREKVFGDTEAWELTAGLGIVPKWVSRVGLWSFSAFLASLVFLVWSVVRWASG